MKTTYNKADKHPFAINIIKLQRYNFNFFNCEETVFFEYIVVKAMAFKKRGEFFHSTATISAETGIKRRSLTTIINRFNKMEILDITLKGMPRVKYFTVDFKQVLAWAVHIYHPGTNLTHLAEYLAPALNPDLAANPKPFEVEKERVEAFAQLLSITYGERRLMAPGAVKHGPSVVVFSNTLKLRLAEAIAQLSEDAVFNSFVCYSDTVLFGGSRPRKFLQMFLTKKNNEFPIINDNLDSFNAVYIDKPYKDTRFYQ